MIFNITVGRKKNGKFIDEPFVHTISSRWNWILYSKAAKAAAKIAQTASEVYLKHGKQLTYGEIKTDKDRPNFTEVEVLIDGVYAFSIEQDALI